MVAAETARTPHDERGTPSPPPSHPATPTQRGAAPLTGASSYAPHHPPAAQAPSSSAASPILPSTVPAPSSDAGAQNTQQEQQSQKSLPARAFASVCFFDDPAEERAYLRYCHRDARLRVGAVLAVWAMMGVGYTVGRTRSWETDAAMPLGYRMWGVTVAVITGAVLLTLPRTLAFLRRRAGVSSTRNAKAAVATSSQSQSTENEHEEEQHVSVADFFLLTDGALAFETLLVLLIVTTSMFDKFANMPQPMRAAPFNGHPTLTVVMYSSSCPMLFAAPSPPRFWPMAGVLLALTVLHMAVIFLAYAPTLSGGVLGAATGATHLCMIDLGSLVALWAWESRRRRAFRSLRANAGRVEATRAVASTIAALAARGPARQPTRDDADANVKQQDLDDPHAPERKYAVAAKEASDGDNRTTARCPMQVFSHSLVIALQLVHPPSASESGSFNNGNASATFTAVGILLDAATALVRLMRLRPLVSPRLAGEFVVMALDATDATTLGDLGFELGDVGAPGLSAEPSISVAATAASTGVMFAQAAIRLATELWQAQRDAVQSSLSSTSFDEDWRSVNGVPPAFDFAAAVTVGSIELAAATPTMPTAADVVSGSAYNCALHIATLCAPAGKTVLSEGVRMLIARDFATTFVRSYTPASASSAEDSTREDVAPPRPIALYVRGTPWSLPAQMREEHLRRIADDAISAALDPRAATHRRTAESPRTGGAWRRAIDDGGSAAAETLPLTASFGIPNTSIIAPNPASTTTPFTFGASSHDSSEQAPNAPAVEPAGEEGPSSLELPSFGGTGTGNGNTSTLPEIALEVPTAAGDAIELALEMAPGPSAAERRRLSVETVVPPAFSFTFPWGLQFEDPDIEAEYRAEEHAGAGRLGAAMFAAAVFLISPVLAYLDDAEPDAVGHGLWAFRGLLGVIGLVLSVAVRKPGPRWLVFHTLCVSSLGSILTLPWYRGMHVGRSVPLQYFGIQQSTVDVFSNVLIVPSAIPWLPLYVFTAAFNVEQAIGSGEAFPVPVHLTLVVLAAVIAAFAFAVNGDRIRQRTAFATAVASRESLEAWATARAKTERKLELLAWPCVARDTCDAVAAGIIALPALRRMWCVRVTLPVGSNASQMQSLILALHSHRGASSLGVAVARVGTDIVVVAPDGHGETGWALWDFVCGFRDSQRYRVGVGDPVPCDVVAGIVRGTMSGARWFVATGLPPS